MHALHASYRRATSQLGDLLSAIELPPRGNRVEKRTDFSVCRRPVLLLNGFFSTRRCLDVLERRLRRDGYCVFSIDLGGLAGQFNTRGIVDLAHLVRAKVERLYVRHPPLGPLSIVGHSKGGLIGAYYVKKLGGWRRAHALVTLGTPHQGTPAALLGAPLGLFARSLWQMVPRSPFIHRLRSGPWPGGVRLTSVWSARDLLAPAPWSLADTGGQPHVRNVQVDAMHRELLFKRRVYDVVLASLRGAEAPAMAAVPDHLVVSGAA